MEPSRGTRRLKKREREYDTQVKANKNTVVLQPSRVEELSHFVLGCFAIRACSVGYL